MKDLPVIGSTVVFKDDWGKYTNVDIQAHFEDKAIFTYLNHHGSTRVDMATAGSFYEITPRIRKLQQLTNIGLNSVEAEKVLALELSSDKLEKASCPGTQHHYIPAGHVEGKAAFICTNCGNSIYIA